MHLQNSAPFSLAKIISMGNDSPGKHVLQLKSSAGELGCRPVFMLLFDSDCFGKTHIDTNN